MIPNIGLVVISFDDLNALLDAKFLQLQQALNTVEQNEHSKSKEELLTRKQAKELLKISYPTLNNWTQKKVIRSTRIQGRIYYSRIQILNLLSDERT